MHIKNFNAGAKKFLYTQKFLPDKKLVSSDDPRNFPEATFTQVLNCNPIKTILFLEHKFAFVHRGPVCFRASFGSVHIDTQSYRLLTFPIKTNKRNLVCLQNSTTGTAERGVNLYC